MARLHPRDTKVGMIPLILGRSSTGDEKKSGSTKKNIGFWNRTGEKLFFFEKKNLQKKNCIDFGIQVSVVNRGDLLISKSVKRLIFLGIVHLEVPLSSSGLEH